MSTNLLTTDIWTTLTDAAQRSTRPASVAVAYFGEGAAKRLPLARGSRLVVDASENTVKNGQTCPAELKKLYERGVRIYSRHRLHAKVFVFGSKAFIGSANVSGHSATRLVEAVLSTTDRTAVADAKEFVQNQCLQSLGPKQIDELIKIYRPPKVPGGQSTRKPNQDRSATGEPQRLMLAQLVPTNPPKESDATSEAGMRVAKRRLQRPRMHVVDEFFWPGECPFRRGDVVVQVVEERNDRRLVSPPGTVIYTRQWRRNEQRITFVFVELPNKRRVSVDTLAKRMGFDAHRQLKRQGPVSQLFGQRLLNAWRD